MDPTDPRPTDEPVTDEPAIDAIDAAEATTGASEDALSGEASPAGFADRHPVLVYTLLRLAILAAVAGVLYLLGARGLILLVFAFLVSGLISMVALSRPREGAAYGITSTVRKVNERIDAASRAEDVDDIDEVMDEVSPDQRRADPPTA